MNDQTLNDFNRELHSGIPLTAQMGLHASAYDGRSLCLDAPLAPNINDKGCAFGGSMASLMTLAAWGLCKLRLEQSAIEADIYVQDSSLEYLAPVWADFSARAEAAEGADLDEFVAQMNHRGKARITLVARIEAEGREAARMQARFVAKRRSET